MAGHIHALMQDADNCDAVAGRAKVDDVLLDAAPSIAWPDIGAALRLLRRFGQFGASGFDQVGATQRLGQIPVRHSVVKYRI